MTVYLLCPHLRKKESPGVSLLTNLIMGLSKPNYLPKAPPLKTITLEARASTYVFWGGQIVENISLHLMG